MSDTGCYFHGDEPIPPNPYQVCAECWHCFNTREDLVAEVNKVLGELGVKIHADNGNVIYTCPLCTHDF